MSAVGGGLFERIVGLGDSICQGTQNVGVSVRSQPFGLPALLARQAGAELPLALVAEPGYPPHVDRLGTVLRARHTNPELLEGRRLDPSVATRNYAIAGARLADVLGLTCANKGRLRRTVAVRRMMRLILNPLYLPEWEELTQVDRAVAEDPTLAVVWVGANDVLEALFYDCYESTPPDRFAQLWKRLIDRLLGDTSALVLVATVPEVTVLPLLQVFRRRRRLLRQIERTIAAFNDIILSTDGLAGRVLVADLRPALRDMHTQGCPVADWDLPYTVRSGRLDLRPLVGVPGRILSGGLVSSDGLHPTSTGYCVLTNTVLRLLNQREGLALPLLELPAVARAEPLLRRPDLHSWPLLSSYLAATYGRNVARRDRQTWPIELADGRYPGGDG